mmetsp:Transcript_20892/g.53375  ORF Transcript_20892/g.53375 Transcript_20892/m.53375 type:complete len:89 (+) Transcript_20892:1685-1951(+)
MGSWLCGHFPCGVSDESMWRDDTSCAAGWSATADMRCGYPHTATRHAVQRSVALLVWLHPVAPSCLQLLLRVCAACDGASLCKTSLSI